MINEAKRLQKLAGINEDATSAPAPVAPPAVVEAAPPVPAAATASRTPAQSYPVDRPPVLIRPGR